MKKKIVTLMSALVLTSSILFANPGKDRIPEPVASAFSNSFSNARDIRWEGLGNYYKVTFEQYGNTLNVFYTENAEFMGVANNILSDKLPDLLKVDLKNKYPGYWITELVKYVIVDKTGFLVTIENADGKIVLKTNDSQHWQVYTKEAKA